MEGRPRTEAHFRAIDFCYMILLDQMFGAGEFVHGVCGNENSSSDCAMCFAFCLPERLSDGLKHLFAQSKKKYVFTHIFLSSVGSSRK